MLTNTTSLKVDLSNAFRQIWRDNLQLSKVYCEDVFDDCFRGFEAKYSAAFAAMSPSADRSPAGGTESDAELVGTATAGPPDGRTRAMLRRFYSGFHDIIEEYCMKARGPRQYSALLEKVPSVPGTMVAHCRHY